MDFTPQETFELIAGIYGIAVSIIFLSVGSYYSHKGAK